MSIVARVINSIQDINLRVEGIESAPHLDETPTSLDTLELPLALTEMARGSNWMLDCSGKVILNLTVQVFVQSFAQDYLGVIKETIAALADAFRDKYRDETSYLYDDGGKTLFEDDEGEARVKLDVAMGYSGYKRLEYPLTSGNFYHGFEVTLTVYATDGGC